MGDAAGDDRDATGTERSFLSVDVEQYFTGEQVEALVRIRVPMQWRRLTQVELVLEQQERAARFLAGGFPRVQPSAAEPALLPLAGVAHRRIQCRHCLLYTSDAA